MKKNAKLRQRARWDWQARYGGNVKSSRISTIYFHPDGIEYSPNSGLYLYIVNGVLCFCYFVQDQPLRRSYVGNLFELHKYIFNSIEWFLEASNYKGEVGFELVPVRQINDLLMMSLNKNGYCFEVKDGVLRIPNNKRMILFEKTLKQSFEEHYIYSGDRINGFCGAYPSFKLEWD